MVGLGANDGGFSVVDRALALGRWWGGLVLHGGLRTSLPFVCGWWVLHPGQRLCPLCTPAWPLDQVGLALCWLGVGDDGAKWGGGQVGKLVPTEVVCTSPL